MRLPRLNLAHVALGWVVFLIGAALVLPPLDSHVQPHPALKALLFVCGTGLIAATFMAAFRYFNEAWGKARNVSNKAAYVVWLSLESLAAIVVLFLLFFGLRRRF
jgi:hypothetical protein